MIGNVQRESWVARLRAEIEINERLDQLRIDRGAQFFRVAFENVPPDFTLCRFAAKLPGRRIRSIGAPQDGFADQFLQVFQQLIVQISAARTGCGRLELNAHGLMQNRRRVRA